MDNDICYSCVESTGYKDLQKSIVNPAEAEYVYLDQHVIVLSMDLKQRLTQFVNAVAEFRKDRSGQDLIEYALMAGFVAVAAGTIMPGVARSISTIFSKVASVMGAAASAS